MSNQTQPKILTEEEVNAIQDRNVRHKQDHDIDAIVKSHRSLLSANAELTKRNRLLVHEDDELLADNMLRRNYESFLKSVIMGREHLPEEHDFEWFKKKWRSIKKPESEELK